MNLTGIQFRLLLLGIAPMLLLAATLALFFIQYHFLDLENALKEKGRATVSQLAIASIYGVFSGNTEVLNNIAATLINEPDIASVSIKDKNGAILAQITKQPLTNKANLLFFQQKVAIDSIKKTNPTEKNATKEIGSVEIALSLTSTHIKQQAYLKDSFILISLGMLTTLLLAIRLSNSISKPILTLTQAANNLADGQRDTIVAESRISEINDLCQSFNAMAIALQQTQNYLMHQVNMAVEELHIALKDLKKKNKSLKKSTLHAINQNKTKSQFLAHISHEIRTPMNGVLGFSELLAKSDLSIHQLDQVQLIKTSASSLLTIVNEILDYASLETGNFNIKIVSFNIRESIENCTSIFFPVSKKVQLIIDTAEQVPDFISTDPIRLQQVITNLLGNACKYTREGHIIVRLQMPKPDALFISVSDTGTGIKENQIQDLFKPFVHNSETLLANDQGTGLGLSICKNIVERLGGKLGVSSREGKGSTFWANLPVQASQNSPSKHKTQRVIVIDANKLRRKSLLNQLAHIGYLTYTCKAFSALNGLPVHHCDVLFYATAEPIEHVRQKLKTIADLSIANVVQIATQKQANTDLSVISLPCRSGFLQNIIETLSECSQPKINNLLPTTLPQHNYSILIADDNEINRLLLQAQLEHHCQHITVAEDGEQALHYLSNHQYDLIFLDLQMPFYNGLELIKKIKQHDNINQNTPIIAVTAHAQNQQRKNLIAAGFDECLIKPVLLEQLQEIINLWLPDSDLEYATQVENLSPLDKVLSNTGNKTDLTRTIFTKLFTELDEQLPLIEQALNSKNFATALEATHRLHGSFGFCGCTEMQASVKILEINLTENNFQEVVKNFQDLKKQCSVFLNSKDQLFEQLSNTQSAQTN